MSEDNKYEIVNKLKIFFKEAESIHGTNNRIKKVIELLDYILTIPKFLSETVNIKLKLIEKINQFTYENNYIYHDLNFSNKLIEAKNFIDNLENISFNANTIVITI